ncbi:valine--tRNA ligase [Candidatus Acetothermia bacterium]|nr:valine--tRNA ligase [Candidatus Acetothermia bacterium]MBI3644082.1 valine--tRNA ligase [Candidatus Acetothermia bacterium]
MELPKSYDPKGVEDSRYQVWLGKRYFHGDVNSKREPFSVVIPPPNVTGELHFGHALVNTLQDIMIRYKRMDGYEACWLPGTDHAGIATQNVVERELRKEGLTRQDLGREKFIERVWAWKEKYGNRIRVQLQSLGCSCDWERERFTLDDGLSKAVIEVFVRLYEEGFIYQGERLINWCPRCHTALSDIEVNHEEKESALYYIQYPVKDSNESLVIATTRPETMLADTSVAVHPKDKRYKKLIGKHVVLPLTGRLIPIIADDAVDQEFGTGALKVTPGHDFADFDIAQRHQLEIINIYNPDCTTNENAGIYKNTDRFEVRKRVLSDLQAQGLLIKEEPYRQSVGHCQRCHTVVEPLLSKQWFVKMRDLAKPAIQVVRNGEIEFVPERWQKIYFDWMENIKDWCISRQLWWGHRIPAWRCDDCGGITVSREAPKRCSKCNSSKIQQDEDVLDTWFSSGLWPFSIMGWPQETPELKNFFPTSLLVTGPDIIFFWVARMIFFGLHFVGEIPFKRVLFNPIVKDDQGRRMSKSLGTGVDFLELKDEFGMDSVRFTLASSMTKGQDLKLSVQDVEGARKFLNKIWNATRFALMNLEDYDPKCIDPEKLEFELEDRWMLSRLNHAIKVVRDSFESFDFNIAATALYEFFWHDLCDWYLELIKSRITRGEPSKAAAQYVLQLTLRESLKLLHPIIPFLTDELWQKLPETDAESAMIAPFPTTQKRWANEDAEHEMGILQELIGAIRTIRSELNVPPNKQTHVHIQTENAQIEKLCKMHKSFFTELARVEQLEIGAHVKRPDKAPRKVFDYAEVFVPVEGLIDVDQMTASLSKERQAVLRELQNIESRLGSTEFLKKAPAEIVERERDKLKDLTLKAERLNDNLELLGANS